MEWLDWLEKGRWDANFLTDVKNRRRSIDTHKKEENERSAQVKRDESKINQGRGRVLTTRKPRFHKGVEQRFEGDNEQEFQDEGAKNSLNIEIADSMKSWESWLEKEDKEIKKKPTMFPRIRREFEDEKDEDPMVYDNKTASWEVWLEKDALNHRGTPKDEPTLPKRDYLEEFHEEIKRIKAAGKNDPKRLAYLKDREKNPKRMKKIMDSNNLINNYSKRLRTNSKKLRSGEEQLDDLGDETNVELGNVKDYAMGNEGYHKKSWESWLEKKSRFKPSNPLHRNIHPHNIPIKDDPYYKNVDLSIDYSQSADARAGDDEYDAIRREKIRREGYHKKSWESWLEKVDEPPTKITIFDIKEDDSFEEKQRKLHQLSNYNDSQDMNEGVTTVGGNIDQQRVHKLLKNNATETSHKDGEKKVEWDGKFSSSTIRDDVKDDDDKAVSEEESLEELTDGKLEEVEKLKSWELWLEKDALDGKGGNEAKGDLRQPSLFGMWTKPTRQTKEGQARDYIPDTPSADSHFRRRLGHGEKYESGRRPLEKKPQSGGYINEKREEEWDITGNQDASKRGMGKRGSGTNTYDDPDDVEPSGGFIQGQGRTIPKTGKSPKIKPQGKGVKHRGRPRGSKNKAWESWLEKNERWDKDEKEQEEKEKNLERISRHMSEEGKRDDRVEDEEIMGDIKNPILRETQDKPRATPSIRHPNLTPKKPKYVNGVEQIANNVADERDHLNIQIADSMKSWELWLDKNEKWDKEEKELDKKYNKQRKGKKGKKDISAKDAKDIVRRTYNGQTPNKFMQQVNSNMAADEEKHSGNRPRGDKRVPLSRVRTHTNEPLRYGGVAEDTPIGASHQSDHQLRTGRKEQYIEPENADLWKSWLEKMQGAGDARFGNQHLTGLDQKPVNNEEDEANILPEKEEKTDDKEEKQEKTDNKPYKALGGE